MLSPVAPLASCSAVAPTSQDRTLSTSRATEVVSDPSTVMALISAQRCKQNPGRQPVRLCTVHQTLRTQPLPPPTGGAASWPAASGCSCCRWCSAEAPGGRIVADMIRLHDCRCSANGHKVRLLLSQLDRPYQLIEVDIFGGASKTGAYLALNPDGRIPLLELEDGRTLPESNAILCYLAEGTAMSSADPFERAQILQWLFFEQNRIEPVLGTARFWLMTGRAASRRPALEIKQGQGTEALGVIERHLRNRTFLVGERYTIADLALHAYSQLAPEAGVDLQPFPAVRAWLDRVRAQPAQVPGVGPYPTHAMA